MDRSLVFGRILEILGEEVRCDAKETFLLSFSPSALLDGLSALLDGLLVVRATAVLDLVCRFLLLPAVLGESVFSEPTVEYPAAVFGRKVGFLDSQVDRKSG